jgi:acyl-coenzyme A thioesterase PaaI-like protein
VTFPDAATVAAGILHTVPFARTLKIALVELEPDGVGGVRAIAELPDDPSLHNHVGGPHAGALFTLGETASGAVVVATFADQLDRAVPLTVRAEIAYRRLARGRVRATARLDSAPAQVVSALEMGERPEFLVRVSIGTDATPGLPSAEMTVVWTLRPR